MTSFLLLHNKKFLFPNIIIKVTFRNLDTQKKDFFFFEKINILLTASGVVLKGVGFTSILIGCWRCCLRPKLVPKSSLYHWFWSLSPWADPWASPCWWWGSRKLCLREFGGRGGGGGMGLFGGLGGIPRSLEFPPWNGLLWKENFCYYILHTAHSNSAKNALLCSYSS